MKILKKILKFLYNAMFRCLYKAVRKPTVYDRGNTSFKKLATLFQRVATPSKKHKDMLDTELLFL